MPVSQPDILIAGGGVIGLTTALKLAERGLAVTLLDRQATGQEASWAGAGMLPPGNLARAFTPESRLRSFSYSLWPDFAARLLEQTGIDNGYHVCGAVEVFPNSSHADFEMQIEDWNQQGLEVRRLAYSDAQEFVPDLNPQFELMAWLPQFAQVRNPRHLQALRIACLQQGVVIIEHAAGGVLNHIGDRIASVKLPDQELSFDQICITAGAWTTSLVQSIGFAIPVVPVRGQIVQLQLSAQPFGCVIEHGRRYVVPRRDGLILVGSTEEHVGFQKENTAAEVDGLLAFASSLVPSLSHAKVARCWSGLRPGSPDELPLIGAVPGWTNVFVGAGHFRSGLQMSPATATLLAELMTGTVPSMTLSGLEADRFHRREESLQRPMES